MKKLRSAGYLIKASDDSRLDLGIESAHRPWDLVGPTGAPGAARVNVYVVYKGVGVCSSKTLFVQKSIGPKSSSSKRPFRPKGLFVQKQVYCRLDESIFGRTGFGRTDRRPQQ